MGCSKRLAVLALLLTSLVGSGIASAQVILTGAGATFPAPLYTRWFNTYARVDKSVRFNYQSIGSGAGIAQISNRMVDFGASDAPMSDRQIAALSGRILHFPTVLGADVITYNLPGLSEPLRFTGPLVADIYLGKVTVWDDPAITKLNPRAKLPHESIIVCHRSDGSVTTYVFTDYLSKVSADWKNKVGRGTSVRWPVGFGANGNQGVTELVTRTLGAIGYVELVYAVGNKLPVGLLQNRAGNWLQASVKTVTEAAADSTADIPADFRISITDAPGVNSYPMSSFTYLLVYQQQSDPAKVKAFTDFIEWMLHDGQTFAVPLSYAPLPGSVVAAEEAQLKLLSTAHQVHRR